MSQTEKPIWSFDLGVHGPFSLSGRFLLEEVDVFLPDTPLFHELDIKTSPHGAQVGCKVYADNGFLAQQFALVYLEQMIDVLGTKTNLPLLVSRQDARPFARERFGVKRALEKHEWQSAYRETYHLRLREPVFLAALGAFRRALHIENPLERTLLHCRSIFLLTDHAPLAISQEPHETGSLSRIHACFQQLWGDSQAWPVLSREEDGFAPYLRLFQKIEHPAVQISPAMIAECIDRLEPLHRLSHAFLTEWRNQHIEIPGEFHHTSIHLETGWGHILQ